MEFVSSVLPSCHGVCSVCTYSDRQVWYGGVIHCGQAVRTEFLLGYSQRKLTVCGSNEALMSGKVDSQTGQPEGPWPAAVARRSRRR